MRSSSKVALIVIAALIGGGFIGFISTGFATAGTLEDTFAFTHEPDTPPLITELNLNSDIGHLYINYNSSATPYYVSVVVDMKIEGLFMSGAVYTDYLTPYTEWFTNTSNSVYFHLDILEHQFFNPAHWFKLYDLEVTITLRTDVVYDIYALTSTGAMEMTTPAGVELNNTILTTSTGSVALTSTSTKFLGDVQVQSSTGSATLIGNNLNVSKSLKVGTSTGSANLNLVDSYIGKNLQVYTSTGSAILTAENIDVDQGLSLSSTTGAAYLDISDNSTIGQDLAVSTSTGSSTLILEETLINNDVTAGTSTGGLNFNLTSTIIGGDLSGIVSTGGIDFISNDVQYLKSDATIYLETSTGSIDAWIYQHVGLGANVTGTMVTSTGSVEVLYRDTNADVGARFVGSTGTGSIDYTNSGNFEELGNVFTSMDYHPALSKYTFSLTTSTGSIDVDGASQ